MQASLKRLLRAAVRRTGYDIVRYQPETSASRLPADLTADEQAIYAAVKPFTMTSLERVVSVIQATRYIVENAIPGAFVECGVWRGGSMMAVAHTLKRLGAADRRLYLYDTFSGMPAPTARDARHDGVSAQQLLDQTAVNTGVWCYADRRDVEANLGSTGYPRELISFVEGTVESTIPQTLPDQICLLRLDTDWYESTRHELVHLYPRLVRHGVLIIDDYGHWQGARRATDEFFSGFPLRPLLQRVDYTGRMMVKCEDGAP